MKFNIPINYDISTQEFFDRKGYDSRREWLENNVDEINLNTI